jgi:hypothetical protein
MLNIKKVKLTANYVLTTKDTYTGEADGGVIIPRGTLKEYQTVVEIGPMVRTVKVGDMVSINPKRYAVTRYDKNDIKGNIEHMQKIVSYNIPEIEIDHKKHLLITDQDIEFVIEEYEEEKPNNIIIPKQEIILPK